MIRGFTTARALCGPTVVGIPRAVGTKVSARALSSLFSSKEKDPTPESPFLFCAKLVAKRDRDGFVAGQYFPKERTDSYWALRAFNVELASVSLHAKDVRTSALRYAWWKDSVAAMYKGDGGKNVPPHPVLQALNYVVQRDGISQMWLNRLITSRHELSNLATIADMEKYAERSHSSLMYAHLESLGIRDGDSDHAASHIGKAAGLLTLLRSTPRQLFQGECYLPFTLLSQAGIRVESLYDLPFHKGDSKGDKKKKGGEPLQEEKPLIIPDGLKDVVFEVADTANAHLRHARSLIKGGEGHGKEACDSRGATSNPSRPLPPLAMKALLSAVPIQHHLDRLQECDFDVFHPKFHLPAPFLVAKVGWASFKDTF